MSYCLCDRICNQDVHDEIDIDWFSLKAAFPRYLHLIYLMMASVFSVYWICMCSDIGLHVVVVINQDFVVSDILTIDDCVSVCRMCLT